MNYKTTDIVAFILANMESTKPENIDALLRKQFPGIEDDLIERAFKVLEFESNELLREHQKQARQRALMKDIFEDLPDETTFGEAVKIKAAQGHPFAIGLLAHNNTSAVQMRDALGDAAYAAHPLFEQRGKFIRWLGDPKDEPSHDAVIEWFQINHPVKAREIERRFETA
jgi:hypothetical protein